MSAPKYSAEFTEQVVPEVVQKSKPIRVRSPGRTGLWRRQSGTGSRNGGKNTPIPALMAPP
ncbi:hypothetical protein, partial [Propionibacterium australiense]|uniref:hypothetical protein n=1 Tax=Propionibacterium australiense TaxID=119981 RepID=UPI001C7DF737